MPARVQFFRPAVAAVPVAVVLTVAGCGGSGGSGGTTDPLSGMSAKQVAAKAIADLRSAPSFTIRGSGPAGGQTLRLSLGYRGGRNCEGTIGLGSQGTLTITVIGTTAWMKASAAFWNAEGGSDGAIAGKLLAGKYLKAPTSSPDISELASVCNATKLTSQMSLPADTAKGRFTTLGGQRVLTLTDKAKDSTMYVTDTAAPRILKVVSRKPGNSGQFTIAYGVPAAIKPPPASETINGSQFGF